MDSTESIHIEKEKSKKQSKKLHKIIILIVVIALSFLIATQWISVLRIQSSSMSPTIDAGQIVIVFKKKKVQQGDIVAYRKKDKLFVKRVIAGQGQYVDIDLNGKVSVDQKRIKEDYVGELSLGKCDISMDILKFYFKFQIFGIRCNNTIFYTIAILICRYLYRCYIVFL